MDGNMKDIIDFIKDFDLHTIIIIAIAFWCLVLEKDIVALRQDVTMIKNILIIKNIMPCELSKD